MSFLLKVDRSSFSAKSSEAAQRLRTSVSSFLSSGLFGSGPTTAINIERDCLTQDEVPDIFVVLPRENGSTIKVDAASLIDYVLATGDYSDPETRQPLSEDILQMLDVFCKRLGKRSILEAREGLAEELKSNREKMEAVSSLESIIGNCVTELYDALEAVNERRESPDDASVRLLIGVAPILQEAFEQLVSIDPESARICLAQQEQVLRGPKQRPTPDEYRFLKVVINILRSSCGQIKSD